ncbi:MAG TPA: prepilin-type N-terminal cleavage/methylation domain-containing protein [Dongiaceae bacterium]|nr:prepilin-type N-terminal cleavage/methylation domain-containing protein [Dongiaceae bacterium]
MSRHKKNQRGFTIIETMAAIIVLTIGLVGLAVLMSNMMTGGARSRYMSNAAMLASEELESLQRYSATAPEVAVTSGTTAGSLTSDVTASVTSGGSTATVDYFDTVQLSSIGGSISETYSGKDSSGNTNYTTQTHSPNGQMSASTSSTAPTPTADTLIFKRRWIIEKDAPVVGVRRITVLVTLTNPAVTKAVNFQMSTVRP